MSMSLNIVVTIVVDSVAEVGSSSTVGVASSSGDPIYVAGISAISGLSSTVSIKDPYTIYMVGILSITIGMPISVSGLLSNHLASGDYCVEAGSSAAVGGSVSITNSLEVSTGHSIDCDVDGNSNLHDSGANSLGSTSMAMGYEVYNNRHITMEKDGCLHP